VPELAEPLDRRCSGRDSLPAERERLAALCRPEDSGDLTARPIEVRLDDLEDEPGRDCRVERVPTALEHSHAGL
jgi:hypothetical protein